MSNKGTPLASVRSPLGRSPLGTINTSTPSKRLYFNSKQQALSKEVVEATDEGRASVDQLSQWLLQESAKKQRHAERSNPSSNAATPVRIRTTPKLKAADVQATDEKRVDVKTISSWMSDDPFEQKKVRHIRSGAKVIAKSRIFEPTQTKTIAINIEAGSVHNKQAWLQEAFKTEANNAAKRSLPSPEVRTYQMKKKKESPEKEFKSVKEKKEWLSNAFKHNDNHCYNHGAIHKSKSVDHGDSKSMNISAKDETAILKSASVDDDVIMCSNDSTDIQQQPTICEAEMSANEDEQNNVMSVADRAKWLKGAFNKK